jgi:hypothetical protein
LFEHRWFSRMMQPDGNYQDTGPALGERIWSRVRLAQGPTRNQCRIA